MQRPSLLRLIPLAVLALCVSAQADQTDPLTMLIANSSLPPAFIPPQASSQVDFSSLKSATATATDADASEAQAQTQTQTFVLGSQTLRTLDLIARPDDIWERVRHGFAVPNIDTALVAQQQAWFLSHGDYLRRAVARSSRYLYHIVEELEKRGMPTELALLPFIESAYNPMAYSPAQASGMWQFIPSTGKDYNLKQNWWQDERRDVVASTDAALTYLQRIYEMHGDWHLALASYNWGEGSVKRAIEKNIAAGLPTDYLSLKMPDETRNYIPKLQAVKNIIANPELFGIVLPKIDNEPYFATINNPQGIDIMTAARLAEMPLEDFKALNPSFNRPVIPGSANATLLLPMDRVGIYEANLESSTEPLMTWQAYTPKKGETLSKIASRFGMSFEYLRQVNGLGPKARLRPGSALLVQNLAPPRDHQASLNGMQSPVLSYATSSSAKLPVTKKMAAASGKSGQSKTDGVKPALAKSAAHIQSQMVVAKSSTARKTANKIATLVKKSVPRKAT